MTASDDVVSQAAREQAPIVITPIIHADGDRRETLQAQLKNAYRALQSALDALRACAPNARNYAPEHGRWERACAQHAQRLMAVRWVVTSITAEAIAIDREPPRP